MGPQKPLARLPESASAKMLAVLTAVSDDLLRECRGIVGNGPPQRRVCELPASVADAVSCDVEAVGRFDRSEPRSQGLRFPLTAAAQSRAASRCGWASRASSRSADRSELSAQESFGPSRAARPVSAKVYITGCGFPSRFFTRNGAATLRMVAPRIPRSGIHRHPMPASPSGRRISTTPDRALTF